MLLASTLAPWMEWFYLAAICLICVVIGAVIGTVIWLFADRRARKKAASLTAEQKKEAD